MDILMAPTFLMAKFHNTKQAKEAMPPRNRRFPHTAGTRKPSAGNCQGMKAKRGRAVSKP